MCNTTKGLLEDGVILSQKQIAESMFLMEVKLPKMSMTIEAGQICMLQVSKGYDLILRRPISFFKKDTKNKTISFLYDVIGKGTKRLAEMKKGDIINIQGPLGRSFDRKQKSKKILVVGGGIGIAPLQDLAEDLKKDNEITFLAGGRTRDHLNMLELFEKDIKILPATDDGSMGFYGNTAELMEELISKGEKFDIVYTCGPHPMMVAISKIAQKNNIKCQVSLEERMACGVGACLGCSVPDSKGGMVKVCKDGPVFWNDEVMI